MADKVKDRQTSGPPRTITEDVLNRAAKAYYETQIRCYGDPMIRPWEETDHDDNNALHAEEIALLILQAAGLEIDESLR